MNTTNIIKFSGDNNKHKDMLLKLLGEGWTTKAIQKALKSELSVSISKPLVTYYKNKYWNEIAAIRERYLRKLSNNPMSSAYWRVMQLYQLYEDILEQNRLWTKEETKFGYRLRGNHLACAKLLEQAREEMRLLNLGDGVPVKSFDELTDAEMLNYALTGDFSDESWKKNIEEAEFTYLEQPDDK